MRLPAAARPPRPPRLPRPLVGNAAAAAGGGAAVVASGIFTVTGSNVVTGFSLLVSETGKLGTKAGTIGAASDGFRGCWGCSKEAEFSVAISLSRPAAAFAASSVSICMGSGSIPGASPEAEVTEFTDCC